MPEALPGVGSAAGTGAAAAARRERWQWRQPASRHQPMRPSWRCRACDQDWPCRHRRAELAVECGGSRIQLAIYMSRFFTDALDDHPDVAPQVFYERFLGWARRR